MENHYEKYRLWKKNEFYFKKDMETLGVVEAMCVCYRRVLLPYAKSKKVLTIVLCITVLY